MACRHFHGTTGSPPPGTPHTPPRRPRWTVRPRSPSRTVADAHAAPPAAGQATASAALLSPQQPNPVVVPSTPRCSGCCDDQLNPPNTPRSPTAAACTPLASSLPWARSGMRWTTPSPRASSPRWNASCSTATPGRPEPGCARRSSISSRSSTTANAATRHSTTPAPSATSSSTYQQHPPPNHRVHESGATPDLVTQAGAVGLDRLGRVVAAAVEAAIHRPLNAAPGRLEQAGHGQGGDGYRPARGIVGDSAEHLPEDQHSSGVD